MKRNREIQKFVLISLIVSAPAAFATITGWRTDGSGMYPGSKPALEWSPEKNVVWKAPMPAWGNGMPVIVGDKIFINAEKDELLCIDRNSGKILWEKHTPQEAALSAEQQQKMETNREQNEKVNKGLDELKGKFRNARRNARRGSTDEEKKAAQAEADKLEVQIHELEKQLQDAGHVAMPPAQEANGYTSATPITDGNRLYIVYGSGIVAAFDLDGNRLWCKLYEMPTHQWGHSTSPLLIDGKLIVHILTMMALNPDTGEVLWKTPVKEGWGTPAVAAIGGEKILATAKGDVVRASDGKKLASGLYDMRWGSPIIHEGILISVDEDGGVAYQLPEKIEGDQINPAKLWSNSPPKARYYSSPIVLDGVLYVANTNNKFSAIDLKSGEILYTQDLAIGSGQGSLYASVVLAGDHLLVSHEGGKTAVIKPGRTFELVGINTLETSRSTPVFVGDLMYFRTSGNLYCIGSK